MSISVRDLILLFFIIIIIIFFCGFRSWRFTLLLRKRIIKTRKRIKEDYIVLINISYHTWQMDNRPLDELEAF